MPIILRAYTCPSSSVLTLSPPASVLTLTFGVYYNLPLVTTVPTTVVVTTLLPPLYQFFSLCFCNNFYFSVSVPTLSSLPPFPVLPPTCSPTLVPCLCTYLFLTSVPSLVHCVGAHSCPFSIFSSQIVVTLVFLFAVFSTLQDEVSFDLNICPSKQPLLIPSVLWTA